MTRETYPYVIKRCLPAVYHRHEVYFEDLGNVDFTHSRRLVLHKKFLRKDNTISLKAKKLLLHLFLELAMQNKFRYCVVFAADECTYIEPDGRIEFSKLPPSDGAEIK